MKVNIIKDGNEFNVAFKKGTSKNVSTRVFDVLKAKGIAELPKPAPKVTKPKED